MTLHRFIHIGDLHLGPNARNEDRRKALDQIIDECAYLEGLAAWLWPGDLNHGRMTIEDRNFLVSRVQAMADRAPVLICYGNHDLPGDLAFLERLRAKHGIQVFERPSTMAFRAPDEWPFVAFALPYPTKAGLVSAGVQHDQLGHEARRALELIFLNAKAELDRWTSAGYAPLMIGHVNVGGSVVSTGQPNIGQEIELDPALIQRLGPIYVGLNHIHKGQEIGGAWYPGSVCRLDWGETERKRYLVVEYFADTLTGSGWRHLVNEQPLDVAPMFHVEGELTPEGFTWAAKKGPDGPTEIPPESFAGTEVRVRYRFNAADKLSLDEALVRAPFQGAARLELDPIAMRSRAVRAPEVAAATTLEQKVQAYVRQSGGSWTPGLDAKLSVLQQPDATAFLNQVQNSIAIRTARPEELVEVEL